MLRPQMTNDPAGYYAELEVDPAAAPGAIASAFRRKARVVHPDVPETGNAAAFMRVKAAYDVLSNPRRRAAYDRSALPESSPVHAVPIHAAQERIGPRLADLPLGLLAGLGGVFCLAAIMAVIQLSHPRARPQPPAARPSAASAPPASMAAPAALPSGGLTTHYVLPSGSDAMLWRRDAKRDGYVPAARLADFSALHAVGFVPAHGLVEIELADGSSGYIDADRLAPGDRAIAHRAYCAYNAGVPPHNGEVFAKDGGGHARLTISNQSGEPAVVKLRDAAGHSAASVFVAAGATTALTDLPDGVYRPDFAVGELWSRACGTFTAGMRAQRFAGFGSLSGLSPLVIPPELSAAAMPVDIPDQTFQQE